MKKIFALSSAAVLSASPAFAGTYLNVEGNTSFVDGDYSSTLLETHVGYEGELGDDTTRYVQGGPAFQFVDGAENGELVSGKLGMEHQITEELSGYGEIYVVSADDWDISDSNVGIKSGLTYRF